MDFFWTQSPDTVLSQLKSSKQGISAAEAEKRLATYGLNTLGQGKHNGTLALLLSQF